MLNMKKIDFIVIGTQKAGTTSMIYHMNQHPDIFMFKDEIHFFDSTTFNKNYQIYHNKFIGKNQKKIIGEKTPSYSYLQFAIDRIYEYNPEIKLIFILRNPIKRAFSEWNMYKTNFNFKKDFKQSIIEIENVKLNEIKSNGYWALQRGYYFEQIDYILTKFNKENLFIGIYEDIKKDSLLFYNKMFNFLGLENLSSLNFDITIRKNNYIRNITNEETEFMKEKYNNENKKLFDFLGREIIEWV
jgi:hypothetical protein